MALPDRSNLFSKKVMKSQFRKRVLSGIIGLSLAVLPVKAATYISGQIAFTGGATLNGSAASATALTSFFGPLGPGMGGPTVLLANGDYSGIPNDTAVTFNPFTFNPAPLSSFQLWSVNVGGTVYSFDVTSLSVVFQNANFVNIQGTGIANITGFNPTPGNWRVTLGGFDGFPVFTFGSVASVPEPSTSALVLGAGLMMFVFRRVRSRT